MYVKLLGHNMTNRNVQWHIGLNVVDQFNNDPNIDCTEGIYFCRIEDAFGWHTQLGYNLICDVVI
jgi:hypothetical protein